LVGFSDKAFDLEEFMEDFLKYFNFLGLRALLHQYGLIMISVIHAYGILRVILLSGRQPGTYYDIVILLM